MNNPETLRLCAEIHRRGFSLSHLALLCALPPSGWMTASELVDATGWSRRHISEIIGAMADNRMIEIDRGARGGRPPQNETRIQIAAKGAEIFLTPATKH